MEFVVASGCNSSGKDVNSQLKINGIRWLNFSHVIKFHGCILVSV